MKPMIVITDAVQDKGDVSMREKTIAVFGYVVYRRCECYPIVKDRTIGFSGGASLTYVEDE